MARIDPLAGALRKGDRDFRRHRAGKKYMTCYATQIDFIFSADNRVSPLAVTTAPT